MKIEIVKYIKLGVIIFLFCLSWIVNGQSPRPNVLLIISDQHAGKVMTQRGYSHIQTPGIDQLAARGVTFTRAYCAYPVCTQSRAAMITGVMPSKSHDNLTDYTSIGSTMKELGYQTAYFGKWHVGESNMDEVSNWHGFEEYKDLRNDTRIRELSNNFIGQKRDKPFFMITSLLNPHDCCELARNMAGLNDKYHDGPVEENAELKLTPELPSNFRIPPNEPEGFYVRRTPDSTNKKMFRKHPVKYWGETQWRQYMYGYDRLVEKVDAHILSILNKLEESDQLDNTVIIYTSDHGDGHASHEWNQKMTFYEESVNVPFIVSWKGKTISNTIDQKTLVNTGLDILPTIMGFLRTDIEHDFGSDLSKTSLQKSTGLTEKRNYVVSEMIQLPINGKSLTGRMLVTDRYKYVLFDDGENREQLYDLKLDPGEISPVTKDPSYQNQLQAHREMLKDWLRNTDDSFSLDFIP